MDEEMDVRGSAHQPDLCLRPARPDDRDFFFAVRRSGFRLYVDGIAGWDDQHQRELANREFDSMPVQIVERDGLAVGYICVVHEDDHDDLDEIALLPHARGHGTGTGLVVAAMRAAGTRGVPLRLSVYVNNPARRLYDRLGFRVVAVRHPRVHMEWTTSA
jgi:ribosomal protein S18 acetylase RimI-like enzyme